MLLWADVRHVRRPRYCAIWVANPERIAWNIDAVDEGGAALQQRFEAMAGTLARPAIIAVTPAARIMELYVDSQIGPWASRAGMTSADYQTEFTTQANAGLWPVCVSASGEGSHARFAAIFATREEHLPRVFRSTGMPRWRRSMQRCRATSRIRICAAPRSPSCRHAPRLRARHTFAEASPAYHDIKPATPFRQASISKTFCAIAVWKLIEQGQLTLDTTLQSV
jgi:hypothetical protein